MEKLFIYILLILSFFSKASHIVGGEFALTRISGNTYRISFFLFQDVLNANPGAIDSDAEITFFDKATHSKLDSLVIPLVLIDTLESEDGVCSFVKFKTSRLTYQANIVLTAPKYTGSQGFYVAWDRCCRNNGTNNITNSDQLGTLIYAEFPPVTTPNSSPQFSVPIKTVYGCIGIPQQFSFAATDPNGDDLVYSIEIPLIGFRGQINPKGFPQAAPYLNAPMPNMFSRTNLIPGNPAADVNSMTGILSFVPTLSGFYALRVKVQEFRNGIYLGEVNREYQLVISSCYTQNVTPGLKVFDLNTDNFVHTFSGTVPFEADKAFTLTFAGIDTLRFQKLSMKGTSLNFGDRFFEKSLTPNLHIVRNNKDTAFYAYTIPACTYNQDSLYQRLCSIKHNKIYYL